EDAPRSHRRLRLLKLPSRLTGLSMRTFWRRTMPSRPTEASTRSPTLRPTASRTLFGIVTWNFGPTLVAAVAMVRKSYFLDVGDRDRSVNVVLACDAATR